MSNVKRKIGLERNSVENIKFTTPSIVSRVIEKIDIEVPPSQRSIAQSCRISQSIVSRMLILFFVKDVKVHKLTLSTIEKRTLRQLANYRYNRQIVLLSRW